MTTTTKVGIRLIVTREILRRLTGKLSIWFGLPFLVVSWLFSILLIVLGLALCFVKPPNKT